MKNIDKFPMMILALIFGWLLSLPMNGPVLVAYSLYKKVDLGNLSLFFICVHALSLLIIPFINSEKLKAAQLLFLEMLMLSLLNFTLIWIDIKFWYIALGLMAFISADIVIKFGYYYTKVTSFVDRIKYISMTIVIGNIFYYIVSVLSLYLRTDSLVIFTTTPLLINIVLIGIKFSKDKEYFKINISINKPIPHIFILMMCNLTFGIFINCGFMSMVIYPHYEQFWNLHLYLETILYIIALMIMYFIGDKVQRILPLVLCVVFIFAAFLSFMIFESTIQGYILIELFIQFAYAFVNVFLWTLLGDVASIYGREFHVFGIILASNVISIFAGSILGAKLISIDSSYKVLTGVFSLIILFLVINIIPWINERLHKDIKEENISKKKSGGTEFVEEKSCQLKEKDIVYGINLGEIPNVKLLTPREMEVIVLLLKGYTNKTITEELFISENTLKVHNRNIYKKLQVKNRKELFQLTLSSKEKANTP
ncbi:LuxR family transcriptional regulator [Clostridium grantii]|uniref:Regulatory protein, luxR family n=1 Tax=Clostridium grantii DSM 8605 TaxID=1121316 RepID=A0A1M5QGI4_9CLOT|nr:LuxR family transcriptional regulator [Clostridium grantii]SHH13028.1 regulatory protein, luxR family [Clostridium grantii DSM 8605]